jgi:hypothetical protein
MNHDAGLSPNESLHLDTFSGDENRNRHSPETYEYYVHFLWFYSGINNMVIIFKSDDALQFSRTTAKGAKLNHCVVHFFLTSKGILFGYRKSTFWHIIFNMNL